MHLLENGDGGALNARAKLLVGNKNSHARAAGAREMHEHPELQPPSD